MLIISLILLVVFIVVLSQFGARLPARSSLFFWAVGLFSLFGILFPSVLTVVSRNLNFTDGTGLILSLLALSIFIPLLDLIGDLGSQTRKFRRLIASLSSDEAVQKLSPRKTDISCLIVVPCFNEQENLKKTIQDLKKVEREDPTVSFLLVDDGSTDLSSEILSELAPDNHTTHRTNVGVGGVLLTGFMTARRLKIPYVVQFDGDGQHPAEQLLEMISEAKSQNIDLLIGSRFCKATKGKSTESTSSVRMIGILVIRSFLYLFGKEARITDPTSGFRVYSRNAQDLLERNMPDEYPEPESIAILALNNCKLSEQLVRMSARTHGVSSIGKLKALRFMLKVVTSLLGHRIRSWVS
jgi:hypothetical protein